MMLLSFLFSAPFWQRTVPEKPSSTRDTQRSTPQMPSTPQVPSTPDTSTNLPSPIVDIIPSTSDSLPYVNTSIKGIKSSRCGAHEFSPQAYNASPYRWNSTYTGNSAVLPSLPTYYNYVYYSEIRPDQNPIPDSSTVLGRKIFPWYDDIGYFVNCPEKIFEMRQLTENGGISLLTDNTNKMFNVFTALGTDLTNNLQSSSISSVTLENYAYPFYNYEYPTGAEKSTLGYLISPIKTPTGTRCLNAEDLKKPEYSFLKNSDAQEVAYYQSIFEFTAFKAVKFVPITNALETQTTNSYFPLEAKEVSLFLTEESSRSFIFKVSGNENIFASILSNNEDYFIIYPFKKKYKKIVNTYPPKPEHFQPVVENGSEVYFHPFTLSVDTSQYKLKKQDDGGYIKGCSPVLKQ